MKQFKTPKNKVIGKFHFLQRHITHFGFEVFLVIQYKYPEEVQQRIEEPEIQVLVAMQRVSFLGAAHPHPGLDINIVIHAGYIRVRMVNDIMLHIPHKTVSAKDIQGESSQGTHPFVFAETAVRAVMHYIKSDRCDYATQ